MVARVSRALLALLTLAGLLVAAPPAQADVIVVNLLHDPAPDGCTPQHCSLREAVMAANRRAGPDVIRVPEGRYRLRRGHGEPATVHSGPLQIHDDVTIVGERPKDTVVRQFAYGHQHFIVHAGDVRIMHMTLRDGKADKSLTGISNREGARLVVQRVRIVRNDSQTQNLHSGDFASTSGIGNAGFVVVRNSLIAENFGHGLVNGWSGARAVVIESRFVRNHSGNGSTIFSRGRMVLDRVDVVDNGNSEGAVWSNGTTIIRRSALRANRARGVTVKSGRTIVADSTISGNEARIDPFHSAGHESGGGIGVFAGEAVVARTTIADNVTGDDGSDGPGDGGGIFVADSGASVRLKASIVGDNQDPHGPDEHHDCSGPVTSADYNVIEDVTGCSIVAQDRDAFGVDPVLDPLGHYGGLTQTHRLRPESPAIDRHLARDPQCRGVDQRGVSRPQGPRCDAGAFER